MLSQQKALAVFMTFSLVIISPALAYVGARGIFLATLISAAVIIVFRGGELHLHKWFLAICVAVFLSACIPAFYWADPRYILSPVFFVFSLLLIQLAGKQALHNFITMTTVLMFALLIGGFIGLFLAFNGVQPVFNIPSGDGRPIHFFYTTFSNSWWGRIIRPAGIFDEPGALSFMVCGTAALRHLQGRKSRVTWMLLGLGFVTLSLAHLVYVLIHAMAEKFSLRNVIGITATLLPLILVATYLGGAEIVEKRLLGRLTISETGELVGDNRSERIRNAARQLKKNPQSIMFGAHPTCRFDPVKCAEEFGLMGESPLSSLVMQGIFVSWPYYAALVILFCAPFFGREYLVSFGIGALLLQRPYLLNLGYALVGCLVVVATITRISRRHIRPPGLAAGRCASLKMSQLQVSPSPYSWT
jgi:hypothetical protein